MEDLDLDRSDAGLEHADLFCSGRGEVDDAVRPDATVVDPDDDRTPVAEVDDAHEGAEGKGRMTGGECGLIEDFAAGGGVAIEHIAVPGADAGEQAAGDVDVGVTMRLLRSGSRSGRDMERSISVVSRVNGGDGENSAATSNDRARDQNSSES